MARSSGSKARINLPYFILGTVTITVLSFALFLPKLSWQAAWISVAALALVLGALFLLAKRPFYGTSHRQQPVQLTLTLKALRDRQRPLKPAGISPSANKILIFWIKQYRGAYFAAHHNRALRLQSQAQLHHMLDRYQRSCQSRFALEDQHRAIAEENRVLQEKCLAWQEQCEAVKQGWRRGQDLILAQESEIAALRRQLDQARAIIQTARPNP